jgi:hypothetical protein
MDIIVTTPKAQMETAALEAENIKEAGGGFYFRYLGRQRPKHFDPGDRVFYVEDGFIRGFAYATDVTDTPGMVCDTSGRQFRAGYYAFMDAETWTWVRPIPMRGFQGWRYFDAPADLEIIGGWLDPRPVIEEERP